jgi:hypothetical protein
MPIASPRSRRDHNLCDFVYQGGGCHHSREEVARDMIAHTTDHGPSCPACRFWQRRAARDLERTTHLARCFARLAIGLSLLSLTLLALGLVLSQGH